MATFSNQLESSSSFAVQNKFTSSYTNQQESKSMVLELLIGDGFFLSIGDGFRLDIDTEQLATYTNQSKN